MAIDKSTLFNRDCPQCEGGRKEKKENCPQCNGHGIIRGLFSRLEGVLFPHELTGIQEAKKRGLTAAQGRAEVLGSFGAKKNWYSLAEDDPGIILLRLLEGGGIILEVEEGKFFPISIEHWRGCFNS